MKTIERIRRKFSNMEYEFTIPHFFEEMADDELDFSDIENIINTGRVRKKLIDDPRGTRYEIVGICNDGSEAAIICRLKSTGKLLFITVYAL